MPKIPLIQGSWFGLFSPSKTGGFTLTEILISLTILALITAVAVPNYRRYQINQDFLTSTSDLKNDFKKVQNSFVSSVKCDSTRPTAAWELVFTSGTPITYILRCYYSFSASPVTAASKTLDTEVQLVPNGLIRVGSPGITCLSPVIFRYDLTGFGYSCSGDAAFTRNDSFTIQLRNSANTSLTKNFTISSTGVIQEN